MTQQFNNSQLLLIARIKKWCIKHYDNGGSWIVECFTDSEIIETFRTVKEAKEYCRAIFDREQDVRNA